MKTAGRAQPQEHVAVFSGGLNLTGNTMQITDGEALVMQNYEINTNGNYQSITGIERFDGQPAPSEAVAPNPPYTDDAVELQDLIAEREARRALIQPVPGSGPVRGVYFFLGRVIAFRDTADGLGCAMYQSSETGWQAVTTPALNPGGKYEFVEINYPGRGPELIGVDGKNHGFIWDGTTYTEIVNPGMDATGEDQPTHVAALPAEIIMFSYPGGSLQYSAIGNPLDWDGVNGAGEIALADEITGISPQAKESCAVFCLGKTYMIRGRVPSTWEVDQLYSDSGAIPGSIQSVGDSIFLDLKGLTRLSRVQQFGDFDNVPLSAKVQPLMLSAVKDLTCSVVVNSKNQYRLFLKTGAGISVTMVGGEVLGISTFDYGYGETVRAAYCAVSVRVEQADANARERTFIGGYDGYVYELDRGTSLDGDPIVTYLRTAYSPFGGQQPMLGINKRIRRATLTIKTVNAIPIELVPSFDYSDLDIPEHIPVEIHQPVVRLTRGGEGNYWSAGGLFDESYWDNAVIQQIPFDVRAVAESVSIYLRTESTVAGPHILSSVSYRYYTLRRRP